MSPSAIAQNGPASTRVRSSTRIPWSGGRAEARGGRRALRRVLGVCRSVLSTAPRFPAALGQALGDRGDLFSPRAGAPPEQPGPVGESHVGEVEHRVDFFDGDDGADLESAGLVAMAEQPRAAL